MNTPKISVVMSVYNSQDYLDESISSILNQTFRDFEFIIINDGSTDKSLEIIKKYKNMDERIIIINHENRGIPASVNEGIKRARTEYIARMDADDISINTRLQEQFDFLSQNPHIGVCGSWIETFGDKNRIRTYPTTDSQIKALLLFNAAFANSSTLLRKSIFDKYQYSKEFDAAEDYKLWVDLMDEYKFANIPKVLQKYRIHLSHTNKKTLLQMANLVRKKVIKDFNFSESEENTYFQICSDKIVDINKTIAFLHKILEDKRINKTLHVSEIRSELSNVLWRLVKINKLNRFRNFIVFMRSDFYIKNNLSLRKYIGFFVRLLLRFPDGK